MDKVSDLKPGITLEGVVTNVANFGAFVDIGVHQDGLVHISALSNKFVSDPREVVKAGQIVKVKVVEVDLERNRIGLTMRLDDEIAATSTPNRQPKKAVAKRVVNPMVRVKPSHARNRLIRPWATPWRMPSKEGY